MPDTRIKVAAINKRKIGIHYRGNTIALTKAEAINLCNEIIDLIESQK